MLSGEWNYTVGVMLNVSNVETYEQILATFNAASFPIQLDNNTVISGITFTTGESQC